MSIYPPYFSEELKRLILLNILTHSRFTSASIMCDYKAFSSLRVKFKYLPKKCFRVYASNMDTFLKNYPRDFWTFIKSNKSNNNISKSVSFIESFIM